MKLRVIKNSKIKPRNCQVRVGVENSRKSRPSRKLRLNLTTMTRTFWTLVKWLLFESKCKPNSRRLVAKLFDRETIRHFLKNLSNGFEVVRNVRGSRRRGHLARTVAQRRETRRGCNFWMEDRLDKLPVARWSRTARKTSRLNGRFQFPVVSRWHGQVTSRFFHEIPVEIRARVRSVLSIDLHNEPAGGVSVCCLELLRSRANQG